MKPIAGWLSDIDGCHRDDRSHRQIARIIASQSHVTIARGHLAVYPDGRATDLDGCPIGRRLLKTGARWCRNVFRSIGGRAIHGGGGQPLRKLPGCELRRHDGVVGCGPCPRALGWPPIAVAAARFFPATMTAERWQQIAALPSLEQFCENPAARTMQTLRLLPA